ncbi:MAG: hypothetical protein RR333_08245 [Bacteroidales bacterium]
MQENKTNTENILLPPINHRIQKLIKLYAKGSVKKFSEIIGLSSSQKLNRIFNIDIRNQQYPIASIDIITAIANMFSSISMDWLLTGDGPMNKLSDAPVSRECSTPNISENTQDPTVLEIYKKQIAESKEQIHTLLFENKILNKEVGRLEGILNSKNERIDELRIEIETLKKDFQTHIAKVAMRAVK